MKKPTEDSTNPKSNEKTNQRLNKSKIQLNTHQPKDNKLPMLQRDDKIF